MKKPKEESELGTRCPICKIILIQPIPHWNDYEWNEVPHENISTCVIELLHRIESVEDTLRSHNL